MASTEPGGLVVRSVCNAPVRPERHSIDAPRSGMKSRRFAGWLRLRAGGVFFGDSEDSIDRLGKKEESDTIKPDANTEEIEEMFNLDWYERDMQAMPYANKDHIFDDGLDLWNAIRRIGIPREGGQGLNLEEMEEDHPLRRAMTVELKKLRKFSIWAQKQYGLKPEEAERLGIDYFRLTEGKGIPESDKDFMQLLFDRGTGRTLYQGQTHEELNEETEKRWEDYYEKRRRAKRMQKGKPLVRRSSSDFDTTTDPTTHSSDIPGAYRDDIDDIYNTKIKPEGFDELNVTKYGLPDPWDRKVIRERKKQVRAYVKDLTDPNKVQPEDVQREKAYEMIRKKFNLLYYEDFNDEEKLEYLQRELGSEIEEKVSLVRGIQLHALRDGGRRIFNEIKTLDEELLLLNHTRNLTRAKLVLDFVRDSHRMYSPINRWMVTCNVHFPAGKEAWTMEDSVYNAYPQPCGFYDCECGVGYRKGNAADWITKKCIVPDPFYKSNLTLTEDMLIEDPLAEYERQIQERSSGSMNLLEFNPEDVKLGPPIPRFHIEGAGDAGEGAEDLSESGRSEEFYMNEDLFRDPGEIARSFATETRASRAPRRRVDSEEEKGFSSGEKSSEEIECEEEKRAAEDEPLPEEMLQAQNEPLDYKDEEELDAILERQQYGA